jgi:hypothetical protein
LRHHRRRSRANQRRNREQNQEQPQARQGTSRTAALKAFHAASASPDLAHRIDGFARTGLELNACGNTMKAQNVKLKDLLPGFINADRGGVVRIANCRRGATCNPVARAA